MLHLPAQESENPMPAEREDDLEPSHWWETHASLRQREARNHVRLMLRGARYQTALLIQEQERLNRRWCRMLWCRRNYWRSM